MRSAPLRKAKYLSACGVRRLLLQSGEPNREADV
jgi:hypothetical protein